MPWEFTPADITAHAAWLHDQGYADSTIAIALDFIAIFYRYCADNHIDPDCVPGFNPAAGIPRPCIKKSSHAVFLTRAEVDALLSVIALDHSPLALRDYAFVLARLRLGVRQHTLRNLQWRQLEFPDTRVADAGIADAGIANVSAAETGVCVRWYLNTAPAPLPNEVWNALHAYLLASGRLESIQPDDYIFAPLVSSHADQTGDKPQDWHPDHPIGFPSIRRILQDCARLTGIPISRLNLRILRSTALHLRLDAGDSLTQLRDFMDVHDDLKGLKHRWRHILPGMQNGPIAMTTVAQPQQPEPDPLSDPLPPPCAQVYNPQTPVPASIHSLYAREEPAQAVSDLMQYNDLGIDEERRNLRTIGRILLELLDQATGAHEIAQLSEAYTNIASLVSEMLALKKFRPDKSTEYYLEHLKEIQDAVIAEDDRFYSYLGVPPGVRPPTLEFPDEEVEYTDALEEIASTRLVLRRLLELVLRADQESDFLHLSLLYTRQCRRLLRILRHEATRRGLEGDDYYARFSMMPRHPLEQFLADDKWLEEHGYVMPDEIIQEAIHPTQPDSISDGDQESIDPFTSLQFS